MSISVDVTNADTAAACTGNAATATKLETAYTINGVAFDGSADITLPANSTFDSAHSFTSNGYQKLNNGLIFQWCRGSNTTTNQESQTVTFPISFPSACLSIQVSDYICTGSDSHDNMWWQIIDFCTSYATVVLQAAQ
ncbi:MAG: hypothetical protein H6Q67_2028 [Firmicutes bacterium]|nr:hypothetical protein [Bacillota bacterium]